MSLFEAVESGDVNKVTECEGLTKELNGFNAQGETPLLAAVKGRNIAIVEALLKAGASVNQGSEEVGTTKGYTGLHYAARHGDMDSAKLLLKNKADINRQSADGWSPLHCAVFSNHQSLAEYLVNQDADINIANQHGLSPLVLCASKGLNPLLRFFIAHGGKLDTVDTNGDKLMHHTFHYQMSKLFEGDYELPEIQYDIGVTLAIAGVQVDELNAEGKTGLEYVDDEMPAYHDALRIIAHNSEKFRNTKTVFNYMTLLSVTVEVFVGVGLELKHAVDLCEKAKQMEKERQAEKKRRSEERPAGGCPVMKSGGGRRKKGADGHPDMKDMKIPTDGSDPSGGQCPFFQKGKNEPSKVEEIPEAQAAAEKKYMDTPHGKVEVPTDGSDPSKGQCPFFKAKPSEVTEATTAPSPRRAVDAETIADKMTAHQEANDGSKHRVPSLWEAVYENRVTVLLVVIGFFCGIWFEQVMAPMRMRHR